MPCTNLVFAKAWFPHKQVLSERFFEGGSYKPVDRKVEGSIDHLQQLDNGEDVEIPYLEVPLVGVVTLEHGLDGDRLIDAGHHSEMGSV